MNELQIFCNDIIPVYITDTGEKVVLGRELHEKLSISTAYKDWFPRMTEYGFHEGDDFNLLKNERVQNEGGREVRREVIDHILKLEMAKHIAMIQRTERGKAIRDKLIALETNVSNLSPELRLLINMELQQKEQAKAIADVNNRLDGICEIVSLNSTSWREDTRHIIGKIALAQGGYECIKDVQAEIYKLVDARAGVSLSIRLDNMRKCMAAEGVCKSKRDKLTKLDVIAKDKKLIEVYLAIVKDMAVKNGISL